MALPFRFSSRRVGEVPRAGPFGAFLGAEYDPVWTDFIGEGTRGITKILAKQTFEENDPYMGVTPDSHFVVPSATTLQPDMTLDRLNQRRSLLDQLEQGRADLADTSSGRQFDRYRQMTYELLKSDQLRTALDTRRETPQVRRPTATCCLVMLV